MKIKMYDYNGTKDENGKFIGLIELPPLPSYKDRLNYIEENIFSNEKYKSFYGIFDEGEEFKLNKKLSEQIENRWLGIKTVGQPDNINEHVKFFVDSLANYLLNSKNYSSKKQISRYYNLKKKLNTDLKDTEKLEYELLEKNFLFIKEYPRNYKKENVIFYINKDAEQLFIDKNIKYKYDTCNQYKEECINAISDIEKYEKEKTELLDLINMEYSMMNEIKDKELSNSIIKKISGYSNRIKMIEDEIMYLEKQISYLYSDYVYITECI